MNSIHPTSESLALAPGAIGAAAKLRPLLASSREAFQRGLGDAGICTSASLTFDDTSDAPRLGFAVQLMDGGSHKLGDRMRSLRDQTVSCIEERGAACATAIRAGLLSGSEAR